MIKSWASLGTALLFAASVSAAASAAGDEARQVRGFTGLFYGPISRSRHVSHLVEVTVQNRSGQDLGNSRLVLMTLGPKGLGRRLPFTLKGLKDGEERQLLLTNYDKGLKVSYALALKGHESELEPILLLTPTPTPTPMFPSAPITLASPSLSLIQASDDRWRVNTTTDLSLLLAEPRPKGSPGLPSPTPIPGALADPFSSRLAAEPTTIVREVPRKTPPPHPYPLP